MIPTHRQRLNDGPVEIAAWKSCDGCRHFAQRAGMPGGDCQHPLSVTRGTSTGIGQFYISRRHDGSVVTPAWCPVMQRAFGQ